MWKSPIKEQQAMSSVPVHVGLDYHTTFIQVCVVDAAGKAVANRKCANAVGEIVRCVEGLGQVRRVAIEACCGATDFAEDLAAATGWRVSLAHPGYVARMKHNPDKTDYGDARMLAELCRVGFIAEVWPAPLAIREMRALVRAREDGVKRVRAVKCRVLAVLREQRIAEPVFSRWTLGWVAWLKAEASISRAGRLVIELALAELAWIKGAVARVERELEELTRDDPVVKKLREIKCVGRVTAWVLRAIVGRFDRFRTGKQLARFCAVTPRNASSGERTADAGMIRAGDMLLRGVLVQLAHRLVRFDPRWAAFAARMRRGGEGRGPAPTGVIVGAVANRFTRRLFHQMKGVPQQVNGATRSGADEARKEVGVAA
jgi:transposase